jgi:hypothetical protein
MLVKPEKLSNPAADRTSCTIEELLEEPSLRKCEKSSEAILGGGI